MSETTPFVTGVDFIAQPTADYDAAAAFYGDILGLPFGKRWGQMPAGEFQAGNLTIALMQSDAFGGQFRASSTPIALHVEDVSSARERLEGQGVSFRGETIDSGVCHQAFFTDPDGNPLILHHRYAD
ncbi:MAG: VOC family protein [Solirubrobacteraceae bacterium]